MHPSIFRVFGLGEPKQTTVSLQLADRSIKYPLDVIEDVLVKVDKFYFLVDFFVLDMEEDSNVFLIFGRPFLTTGRPLIDVKEGDLILRVQDEQVTFKVFKATPQPSTIEECFKIDTKGKQIVKVPKEEPQKLLSKKSNQPKSTKSKNAKIDKQSFYLKAAPPSQI